jgi:hypothetical protein
VVVAQLFTLEAWHGSRMVGFDAAQGT